MIAARRNHRFVKRQFQRCANAAQFLVRLGEQILISHARPTVGRQAVAKRHAHGHPLRPEMGRAGNAVWSPVNLEQRIGYGSSIPNDMDESRVRTCLRQSPHMPHIARLMLHPIIYIHAPRSGTIGPHQPIHRVHECAVSGGALVADGKIPQLEARMGRDRVDRPSQLHDLARIMRHQVGDKLRLGRCDHAIPTAQHGP